MFACCSNARRVMTSMSRCNVLCLTILATFVKSIRASDVDVCFVGYPMDTYCIERGRLLDRCFPLRPSRDGGLPNCVMGPLNYDVLVLSSSMEKDGNA